MIDEKENLPLFTKVFYHMMRFITKFSIPILVIIISLTLFFAYQMLSLQIDSDVNSFAAGVEPNKYVETPLEKPEGEPLTFITTTDDKEGELSHLTLYILLRFSISLSL